MVVSVVTWMYVAFIRDGDNSKSSPTAVVTEDDLLQHLGMGEEPRNKVEAVQKVLDLQPPLEDPDSRLRGGDHQEEDNAKEEYEDEKMYEDEDNIPVSPINTNRVSGIGISPLNILPVS